jgi:predicted permease
VSKLAKRLWALWHRQQLDRDLEDEMAFHLAMNEAYGGRLGNATALKESCRDLWSFTTLEAWWQDFRYALRTLRNYPLVTLASIVALGLGIGANTTIFAVVSSALSFDTGVDRIDRLVALHPGDGLANLDPSVQAPLDFLNLRGQVKTVEHLAAYRFSNVNVSDSHALPERLWCVQMTPSGWAMVRPKPILGREFGPEDERAGAPPAVLLTHKVWERRYGRDPAILGQAIRIDDIDRVVVGIMPVGAQFPEDTDLWTPLTLTDLSDASVRRDLLVFGRLSDGTTLAQAQSEVNAVARRAIAVDVKGPVVRVRLFLEMIGIYGLRPVLIAMVFAVGFVLLIVCADVANLLLARAAARTREISIRIAIGAGRARIIGQLLMESVLLAVAGGAAGWLVALAGLRWFDNLSAQGRRPSWIHFSLDTRAFLYLTAISLGAGILFGLAPALQLAKVDVIGAIKDGQRGGEGPRGRRLAGLLVGFQMALCVVLLAASGLLIHSSVNLYKSSMSVDTSNLLTMRIDLTAARYANAASVLAFYRRLNASLTSLPGVTGVALGSHMPLLGWRWVRGQVERAPGAPAAIAQLPAIVAGDSYFRTCGIRFLRGAPDRERAVVNESFAAKYWPDADPLGRRIQLGDGRSFLVSGVVADVPQDWKHPLDRSPLLYLPYDGDPQASVYVMARTAIPPANLAESFRRAVQSLDANLPAQDVLSLAGRIDQQRLNVTAFGRLFVIFAAIALVLAWVGLYAVVAHSVSLRTQEIGIRMAMGSPRKAIFGLVLKQGMRQVLGGFAAGIPLAILVTQVLSKLLVGVSTLDTATYAGVAIVLGLAGVLGCAIPARNAVRVDPLTALRHE